MAFLDISTRACNAPSPNLNPSLNLSLDSVLFLVLLLVPLLLFVVVLTLVSVLILVLNSFCGSLDICMSIGLVLVLVCDRSININSIS